jgi:hypothetical protein
LAIVLSVLLRYADSDCPFGIFKLVSKLCLYISGKLKMIISRLCLLFLICKGVVSFVRLPCLTNDSKDFEDSQKALTNLESYLGTTIKTLENDVEKSIKIMKDHLAALQKNISQKIKTLNKDLQMLHDDFKRV